ncbi:protein YahM, partial [Escherichia coli]
KKAHTGESGLKWEAKDSSKLIGNKDHALRGLSSPMAGIRQIRLIT